MCPDDAGPLESTGVEKLAPLLYTDVIQPSAREVGTTLGRTVRAMLAPVRGLVWSVERAEAWLEGEVEAELARRQVAPTKIQTPNPQLASGVIRGVQVAGPLEDSTLRELFAGLLASDMTAGGNVAPHPAFAGILADMTTPEAKIVARLGSCHPSPLVKTIELHKVEGIVPFAKEKLSSLQPLAQQFTFGNAELLESYLDNLRRLGLIKIEIESFYSENVGEGIEGEAEHHAEPRARWNVASEYLDQYSDESRDITQSFRDLSAKNVTVDRKLGAAIGERAGLFVQVVWATEFGARLLSATIGGELEREVSHTESSTST